MSHTVILLSSNRVQPETVNIPFQSKKVTCSFFATGSFNATIQISTDNGHSWQQLGIINGSNSGFQTFQIDHVYNGFTFVKIGLLELFDKCIVDHIAISF